MIQHKLLCVKVMRLVLFNGVVNMVLQQLSGEVLLWHTWFPLLCIVIQLIWYITY